MSYRANRNWKHLLLSIVIGIIIGLLMSCEDNSQLKKERKEAFERQVRTIRVLTVEGDTAIIDRGFGTTMTIEIRKTKPDGTGL